jgi:hypothetical protein
VAGASSLFAVRVAVVDLTTRALVSDPLTDGPVDAVPVQDPVVEAILVRRSEIDYVNFAEGVCCSDACRALFPEKKHVDRDGQS